MPIHSIVSTYGNSCIDDGICEAILVFIISPSRCSLSRSEGREIVMWIHSSTGWPIQLRWRCSVCTFSARENSANCSTGTRSVGDCVSKTEIMIRGRQLFTSSFLLAYLNDACMMMQRLPVTQEMKDVVEGRLTGWMHNPGQDYYRLQYMRRYRFRQVKRSSPCECATCKKKKWLISCLG